MIPVCHSGRDGGANDTHGNYVLSEKGAEKGRRGLPFNQFFPSFVFIRFSSAPDLSLQ
jgi:hypothetical protein